MQTSKAWTQGGMPSGHSWSSGSVMRAKSGVSSACQKAGDMLVDCQSMRPVIRVGLSSATKMFRWWRSGWKRIGWAAP